MLTLATVALGLALTSPSRPLLLVHVMPWFERTETTFGYHWKMNKPDREVLTSGRVAAHYQPLIGPYDSLDPHVLELQVVWMKLAGFDGVLANWYGTQPHLDYPMILARTQALFGVATRAGMKIGVVYEDQTVKHAIRLNLIGPERSLPIARETGRFLAEEWLKRPNWVQLKGKPAVLVFGPQHFQEAEWRAFREGAGGIQLITLHRREPYAEGGFDWPVPSQGLAFTWAHPERARDWPIQIPVAFPRFHDYYDEGGEKGHPDLPDDAGRTYRETLGRALAQKADAVQVATWNDWQEGTQIEPSVEFRFRDLVATQEAARRLNPAFPYRAADLEVPLRLYRLRKSGAPPADLEPIGEALLAGRVREAEAMLRRLKATD